MWAQKVRLILNKDMKPLNLILLIYFFTTSCKWGFENRSVANQSKNHSQLKFNNASKVYDLVYLEILEKTTESTIEIVNIDSLYSYSPKPENLELLIENKVITTSQSYFAKKK